MASGSGRSHCTLHNLADDVLLEICKAVKYNDGSVNGDMKSLRALSETHRYMRSFLLPDVFQGIRIRSSEVFQSFVREMELSGANATAKIHIQRLSSHPRYIPQASPPVSLEWLSSRLLPSRLARVLKGMIKLERLLVAFPPDSRVLFREAFETEQVSMNTVQTLVLGPYAEWIISMCPQVTTISTHSEPLLHWSYTRDQLARDIVGSITPAQNIQRLELNAWGADLLEQVVRSVPHLTSLVAPHSWPYTTTRDGLQEILPILSQFTELTHLAIPMSGDLHVGFYPHECGTPFMGPNGAVVWRREQEDWLLADTRVANMVFGACTHLETLLIGSERKANARRTENGPLLEITDTEEQANRMKRELLWT